MQGVFTWKIGGMGGQGQQAAGATFAKACARGGLQTFTYSEFPSVIRGGHGTTQVSVGSQPVTAAYRTIHLLVALNEETIQLHASELAHDGAVIYDSSNITGDVSRLTPRTLFPLPLKTLVQEAKVNPLAANIIALGASFGLLRYSAAVLEAAIGAMFAGKGKETVAMNVTASQAGYQYAQKHFHPDRFAYRLEAHPVKVPAPILTSNDGISLGLAAAGLQLFVMYPMSPASSILHNLAAWAEKTNMVVRHPEDEIAAIQVMLGAMYAGTRAATATSGGGFALMNEAVSLSAMTETPGVIIVSSRPGPATGLPTWTEQGDLSHIVHSGHGDFLRVVLTPGDAQEAFEAAGHALNLAEQYQLPVFILIDKYLSDCSRTWVDFSVKPLAIDRGKVVSPHMLAEKKEYRRYAFSPDGVSPRAYPGSPGGVFLTNSDAHDEFGFSIESFGSGAEMCAKQAEKRGAKIAGVRQDLPQPVRFGPAKAEVTLLGWGSTKGPVLEALRELPDVNYVHLPAVWPIPTHTLRPMVEHADKLVIVENNFSGQFATLLRGQTGIAPHHQLRKYNGQQFFPEELVEKVKALA
ncbi:MAG: 2-oxoacid:acceptor oxidoreductase subunit alpha [Patescibacteria group bacterium]|nr:2-oxoacid:acceptor oxidoreductase subunit alpha [Patescibacteria group bacterium]